MTENIRRIGRVEHLSRSLLSTAYVEGDLVALSVADAIREYAISGGDLGQMDVVVRSVEEPVAGLRVELKGWSA